MADTHVVILAAGKGTRMKSALPKVLHRAAGLPLIEHVLRAADRLSPASIVVVVGHQAEQLKDALGKRLGLAFALQEPQLGHRTRAAAGRTVAAWRGGTLVLLSGDVPLLRAETLASAGAPSREAPRRRDGADRGRSIARRLRADRSRRRAGLPRSSSTRTRPPGEREIREINSGIYAFDIAPLFEALREIGSSNAQGEYYLPDLVRMYRGRGLIVETVTLDDPREILGVNSRKELADVAAILRVRRRTRR